MTPDVVTFIRSIFIQVILNLTSGIDQDIKQSAFACIVQSYTTEGDQVDADNDFTRRAATSSSPGTYAADFYDPSVPISARTTSPRSTISPSRDTRAGDGNVASIVQRERRDEGSSVLIVID